MPPLQAEARLKMDIKATKTVVMAIVTFYICYIPTIAYGIWGRMGEHQVWFAFLASICTFISSASNPIIYVLRNRRYRYAFWQLVKDPCGTSAYQEKPVKTGKEEKLRKSKNLTENPTVEVGKLESEETGVSSRPENNYPESEDSKPTTAKRKMLQPNRVGTKPEENYPESEDRRPTTAKRKMLQPNRVGTKPVNNYPESEERKPTTARRKMLQPNRVGTKPEENDPESEDRRPTTAKRQMLKPNRVGNSGSL